MLYLEEDVESEEGAGSYQGEHHGVLPRHRLRRLAGPLGLVRLLLVRLHGAKRPEENLDRGQAGLFQPFHQTKEFCGTQLL